MTLAAPRWWYERGRRPSPLLRLALAPVAGVWSWVTARRIARAKPVDCGVPVICVGALTVGGAGKTPIVRAIAKLCRDRGVATAVLSRGYGGRLAGPLRADPVLHGAADVGDEPLMMSPDAPVWVSRDRAAGARAAARDGAQLIVMDDGHQNPTVRKALSFLVVDGETRDGEWPFGGEAVVPLGPLREPLAAGLVRADAVILVMPTDLAEADPDLLARFGDVPVLIARAEPVDLPPSGPQLAFAGIAKPWKMERALKAAGCDLRDFAPLPDHAPLTDQTLSFLASRAKTLGAGLVTSEKDAVRLPTVWRDKVTVWRIRARFEDEAALWRMIQGALKQV